jgi:photosystem II stability/assembly factor-like uncharacterized protein
MAGPLVRTDFTRVFLISGRAGPAANPELEGLASADTVAYKQGDIKLVRIPDPARYGQFITVGEIPGDPGMPQLKTTWKYTKELSEALALVNTGCPVDVQIHIGECQDPRDFNAGWDKVLVLENAHITDYATDKLGALSPQERAEVMEQIPFDGTDLYEIKPMIYAEQANLQVTREVVDITVCDLVSCGGCAAVSDGCQVLFAVTVATTGSPGLDATVLYSTNGGQTWTATNDTALPANVDPTHLQCVGRNLVIVGPGTAGAGYVTYAAIADILNGVAVWANVATGIVSGNEPNVLFSLGPNLTWIGGKAGYMYFTADPTSGLTVQDAGVATAQQINAIHGIDQLNLMAVGNSNAVLFTQNGGNTWSTVTGPAVGVNLNCCFMFDSLQWFVGDAAGNLWYTTNAGLTWTQRAIPHQGVGAIRDIVFGFNSQHQTVGYLAVNDATKGYILRTINGGGSWYTVPEQAGTLPTNAHIDALATCQNQNVIFAAGLKVTAGDGIIVKGA